MPRHNGFEACRRIVEPLNEDKALVRKDLLPLATNPKPATSMDDLTAGLEAWDTNTCLVEKSDGVLPAPDPERLALVGLLPPDISANVIIQMELPWFESFEQVKKHALKFL